MPRLGAKTFELAAGFLRVVSSDRSSMRQQCIRKPIPSWSAFSDIKRGIKEVIGDSLASSAFSTKYTDDSASTVRIFSVVEKPAVTRDRNSRLPRTV